MLAIDLVDGATPELSVVPGTAVVLGFQYRGRVRAEQGLLSTAGVTGLQQRLRQYTYLDRAASVLVRFTPQGAACFGVPVSELTGRSVALADLLGPALVRETEERLAEANDARARVAAVEQLLGRFRTNEDPLVTRVLASLRQSDEAPSVSRLARAVSLSERQLERRFLQHVGVSPKRFASLSRFERALRLAPTTARLTDLSLAAGYYDQPHFNREFRRFTGQAPGAFFAARAGRVSADESSR